MFFFLPAATIKGKWLPAPLGCTVELAVNWCRSDTKKQFQTITRMYCGLFLLSSHKVGQSDGQQTLFSFPLTPNVRQAFLWPPTSNWESNLRHSFLRFNRPLSIYDFLCNYFTLPWQWESQKCRRCCRVVQGFFFTFCRMWRQQIIWYDKKKKTRHAEKCKRPPVTVGHNTTLDYEVTSSYSGRRLQRHKVRGRGGGDGCGIPMVFVWLWWFCSFIGTW